MLSEVLIYFDPVVVLLTIRTLHRLEFIQVRPRQLEQLHPSTEKERLCSLFDPTDGLLRHLRVEVTDVNDLVVDIDVVS